MFVCQWLLLLITAYTIHITASSSTDENECASLSDDGSCSARGDDDNFQRLHSIDLPIGTEEDSVTIQMHLFRYMETMGFVDMMDIFYGADETFRAQGFAFGLSGLVVMDTVQEPNDERATAATASTKQLLVGLAPSTPESNRDVRQHALGNGVDALLQSFMQEQLAERSGKKDDLNSKNAPILATGNNITIVSWATPTLANDDAAKLEGLRKALLFQHDPTATHYLILPLVLSSTIATISLADGANFQLDTSRAILVPSDGGPQLSTAVRPHKSNNEEEEHDVNLVISISIQINAQQRLETTTTIVPPHDTIDQDFEKEALPDLTIAPIRWNRSGKEAGKGCHRMGLPPSLSTDILDYLDSMGMVEAVEHYLYTEPFERTKQSNKLLLFNNSKKEDEPLHWYIERPSDFESYDMIFFVPATKDAHVHFLKALSAAGFDRILDAVGKHFGWEKMVIAHLSTLASSEGEPDRLMLHSDYKDTDYKAYNLLIPLIVGNATDQPELDVADPDDVLVGKFKYTANEGVLVGDFCEHGTRGVDFRKWGGYRFYVGIYMTDVNEENAEWATPGYYLDGYPFHNSEITLANAGAHWNKNDPSVKLPRWDE